MDTTVKVTPMQIRTGRHARKGETGEGVALIINVIIRKKRHNRMIERVSKGKKEKVEEKREAKRKGKIGCDEYIHNKKQQKERLNRRSGEVRTEPLIKRTK